LRLACPRCGVAHDYSVEEAHVVETRYQARAA
jgi:hypothetical protein